jgi:predicted SAM-dependent methyltransferase
VLSRFAKASFYSVAGPLMRANGIIYRWFRAPRDGIIKVHLGPGQTNYIPGWINVDANMFTGKCDLWTDLRYPLPFHDDTADAIYSHHVIEHLPDIWSHVREVYRCLKPGGVYRVGGPNADSAIRKFLENDSAWFGDFPDKRTSIGGRFENFVFCRQEHLTILTYSYLEEVMTSAGFQNITLCAPIHESRHDELFRECMALEWESVPECPHTLIVEGVKGFRKDD